MARRQLQSSCGCHVQRGVRLGMSNIDMRFNEPDDADSVVADFLVRQEPDEEEDEDEEEDDRNDDADDETDDGYSE